MIIVPELAGYVPADESMCLSDTTQARHEGKIDYMARGSIASMLDLPVEEVRVNRVMSA
jgi:hypothetical protein